MSRATNFLFAMGLMLSFSVQAQLFQSMASAGGSQKLYGYIFIAPNMSDATQIALARDASKSGMGLVLNGFIEDGAKGWEKTSKHVADINRACCGERGGAHWQINPTLFTRYKVTVAPTFVIAQGESDDPSSYSKVEGEMGVADALRIFYQRSRIAVIKNKAGEIFNRLASNN